MWRCNNCGAYIEEFSDFYGFDSKRYCFDCLEENPIVRYLVWGVDDEDNECPSEKYSREIKEKIEELEKKIKIANEIKNPNAAQKYILASWVDIKERLNKVLKKVQIKEEEE